MARVAASLRLGATMSRFGKHTSIKRIRLPDAPPDRRAACGIGVGVLLGVVAWIAIIAVSVAAMRWF
jgi:hypothetical protein